MKYLNPGLQILAPDATEITNNIKNPINEHALYGNFDINLPNLNTKDIYCKFDVYCNERNNFKFGFIGLEKFAGYINLGIYDEDYGYDSFTTYTDIYYFAYKEDVSYLNGIHIDIDNIIKEKALNHFYIHYNRGIQDEESYAWEHGTITLKINDYHKDFEIDQIEFYEMTKSHTFIFSATSESPVSNIIISDEGIDEKEQLIILPTSSTDTDMTNNNDGSYTATTEDQYILQTVDAASLIRKFGGKSEITSITTAGLPAYKTSDGLSSLIRIESSNNNIIEDTGTTRTLSTYYEEENYYENDEGEYYEGKPNILITKSTSNMTLKDLAGKQYGFKVGV